MILTFDSYILLGVAGLTFLMGFFVWWKNKNNFINKYFLLLCITVGVWVMACCFFAAEHESSLRGYVFAKIAFFMGGIYVLIVPTFGLIYPQGFEKHLKWKVGFFALLSLVFIIFTLPGIDIILKQVDVSRNDLLKADRGKGHIYVVLTTCIAYITLLVSFIRRIKKTSGLIKKQVQYMLLGFLVLFIIAIFTNAIIPLLIKTSYARVQFLNTIKLTNIGTLAPIFWIFFTGYAIVRYKAMEISTVIHKTFAWIVASSLIMIPMGLVFIFTRTWFFQLNIVVQVLFLFFIIATPYYYYRLRLQPYIDHWFQKRKYDYEVELRKLALAFAKILDVRLLTQNIIDHLYRILYTDRIFVVLRSQEQENTDKLAFYSKKNMEEFSPVRYKEVFDYLIETKEVLEKEQIEADPKYDKLKNAYLNYSRDTGIEITFPVIMEDNVIGICGLGKRENLQSYKRMDIDFIKRFGEETGISVYNALHQEDILDKQRLQNEMKIAERIQTALVPAVPQNTELEITAVMKPAAEVGGDYYDIIEDKGKNLWFAIGDVTGHGVTPGLIMMMAQSSFSTILETRGDILPRTAMSEVNKLLYKNIVDRLQEGHNMTMQFLKYTGNGRFLFSNAGHPDAIIYRTRTKRLELISIPSSFLGLLPDISAGMTDTELILDRDDILFLYTDGIPESRNSEDALWGEERFKEVIMKNAENGLEAMRDSIMNEALAWCGDHAKDDMTLMLVRRKC